MDGYIRRFSYDGTLEGFLCTALKILRVKTMPDEICPEYQADITADYVPVRTSAAETEYMYSLIGRRGSAEVQQMVSDFFLTCAPDRERVLFKMIYLALRDGGKVAGGAVAAAQTALLDVKQPRLRFGQVLSAPDAV